jgi:hypothetical protein
MKRLKNFIFVFLSFLVFIPLQTCSQMSNSKILSLLTERYGKEFTILNAKFSPETGKNHVNAICTEFPNLPFIAEYNDQNDHFQSYFEEVLWTDEAKKWVGSHLKKHYSKYAANTNVSINKKVDLKAIPSLQTMLEKFPDSVSFNIQLYLFNDLNEANAESLLKGVTSLSNSLKNQGIEQLSFTVSFYDEAYFKDKKLDDYEFGFNAIGRDNFEKIEEDKFRQKIMFRVFYSSPSISSEMLFAIRTDNAYHLMFHLFK